MLNPNIYTYLQTNITERALDTMNYTLIAGKPCRIMWSHRDPSRRKSGSGNIFIKNLDKTVDNQNLYDTFSHFGNILSCKVETDEAGNSKGYGYIHFEDPDHARKAIDTCSGKLICDKIVFVGPFVTKKERGIDGEIIQNFTNVFVKNIEENVTEEQLRELFEKPGTTVTSCVIMRDATKSRGFGFVNYDQPEQARLVVEEMNGFILNDHPLFVGRAQKKAEREHELRKMFEQMKLENASKFQGVNLYVKNLDDSIDDDELRKLFAPFGTIVSAKVMSDEKGVSKGFGFISFSSSDEATKAVSEMHASMIQGKPIYVALAQKKEVRRAQLEAQHARNAMRNMPQMSPNFMPGPPAVFYGNPVPPQGRYVYNQQMVRPGWRPQAGGPPGPQPGRQVPAFQQIPSGGFVVPPAQRPAQRPQPAAAQPAAQQPAQQQRPGRTSPQLGPKSPEWQQQPQGNARGFNVKYTASARNQPQFAGQPVVSMVPGTMLPQPVMTVPPTPGSMNVQDQPAQPTPDSSLRTELESHPAEEHKQILGERLFDHVNNSHPEHAGKLVGMLLESLESTEIITLLEDVPSLNFKVAEAFEVLQAHSQQETELPAEESA